MNQYIDYLLVVAGITSILVALVVPEASVTKIISPALRLDNAFFVGVALVLPAERVTLTILVALLTVTLVVVVLNV